MFLGNVVFTHYSDTIRTRWYDVGTWTWTLSSSVHKGMVLFHRIWQVALKMMLPEIMVTFNLNTKEYFSFLFIFCMSAVYVHVWGGSYVWVGACVWFHEFQGRKNIGILLYHSVFVIWDRSYLWPMRQAASQESPWASCLCPTTVLGTQIWVYNHARHFI